MSKSDELFTIFCCPGRQDVRDRFSGAVEAFARRNGSNAALHGDHSRHRSSEDAPSSKDVVRNNDELP